ncbi:glycoside hydrolase family 38 C-terminal domain-containing protein [Paenibacillus piri]|uniref:DUF5054 domain-containing protein n=1 Tax=Paenibacillus piri TaxID=2547395 RepID=A0A4R5KUX1_9BACL|nr:glycoside hydrolase family 38 C-terminal domain-containing protein [Paenibacillus piri]TDF99743.1 DUF5054 domain-containing protein [Paenibacillus piri]
MSERLQKIVVVFKTHFDIGFTGLVSEVVDRYSTDMLKQVIDICERTNGNERNERYVWTMSAWPLQQSLLGSSPQDRALVQPFLDNRQLIWHMLPYTTHTEFCGLEEWIRGMYVSRSLSERFGYRPKDAKMTDVPGHTWIVPSLLKKAGVRILHLGCNPASTPPDVPPVFFWEGPDGERLLTFYSKGAYGTGILPPEDWEHPVWLAMIQTSDNHGPHDAAVIDEMKAAIAESGLQAELHIGSLTDFADAFLAGDPQLPVVRGDLADSWIHGVGTAPREAARVRGLRGRIAAAESALALRLLAGEAGDACADAQAIKRKLDESYGQTLLFGEHTWGMDCKSFLFPRAYDKKSFRDDKNSERYRKMERSWQEQSDYLNNAERALQQALDMLGGRLHNAEQRENEETVKTYRIYNYLGWERTAAVVLSGEAVPEADEAWIDASTGERLAWCLTANGDVQVNVGRLPALGWTTIACVKLSVLQQHGGTPAATVMAGTEGGAAAAEAAVLAADKAADANAAEQASAPGAEAANAAAGTRRAAVTGTMTGDAVVLENDFVRVQVDRNTGWIKSLYDKALRKEWVDAESAYGFGQYEYNIYSNEDITRYIKKYAYRFYDWGVHDFGKTDYPEQQKRVSFVPHVMDIRLFEQPGAVRLECHAASDPSSTAAYGNAGEIVWSILLRQDSPYIDMEWRLTGKEETPLAESGHIVFPLKLERPSYRINKMGSVIDPCEDTVRSSSTLLHCIENFIDVSDGTAGMAVVPLDSPLLFIGRNGMWDFEHDYKPEKPELNFNLFNNWWGTNFPQWTGGDLTYRFRLIPHRGDWAEGGIWKTAQETMSPAAVVKDGGYAEWAAPAAAVSDHLAVVAASEPVNSPGAAPGCLSPAAATAASATDLLPHGLDGMAVTCFKPAEDGDGYILRVRDWLGQSRDVAVCIADRAGEIVKTDLLEYETASVALERMDSAGMNRFRFHTEPFEVHTWRIRQPH